jgi:hypothetical protein
MFAKVLSVIDIIAGILYLSFYYNYFSNNVILIFLGVYLISKYFAFGLDFDFANVADIVCGLFFLISIFWTNEIVGWLMLIWFAQKAYFSFWS